MDYKSLEHRLIQYEREVRERVKEPALNEEEQFTQTRLKNQAADCAETLRRIAQGTYGICENCTQPIESDRLEAWPLAKTCIACSRRK